ncbi:MAG: hypothetical protein ACI8W8_004703 [Rhodothermales bacterium]|jgi:hypothetical protein
MKKKLSVILFSLAVVAAIALVFQGSILIYFIAVGSTMWIAGPAVLACCIKIVVDGCKERDISSPLKLLKYTVVVFAVLWSGLHLGKPLAQRKVDKAKAYLVDLLPLLDTYYEENGAYPESRVELEKSRWPRHLFYSRCEDGYEFTVNDPRRAHGRWRFRSETRQWRYGDYYGPCG